jgi:ribosomal-protein-alanine N-acetyltransferase
MIAPDRASGAVVETERLLLRQFTLDDAPFVVRLLNEPSFIQNIADRGVRSLEQAVRYLQDGPLASYERHGHGLYLVLLKETRQPIGMCGLLKREQLRDIDLGYAFLPQFWSRGYAFESAAAVLRLATEGLGASRVAAIVSPGNAPSVRVLQKLGFTLEGSLKLNPGEPDVVVYGYVGGPR